MQPDAHWPKIDHAQAAGLWKTVVANLNLIYITIGAFKYPILTIIASPIVADFQYVVYKYFTQIINVTDILLQFFWGRILYSLDYIDVEEGWCQGGTLRGSIVDSSQAADLTVTSY